MSKSVNFRKLKRVPKPRKVHKFTFKCCIEDCEFATVGVASEPSWSHSIDCALTGPFYFALCSTTRLIIKKFKLINKLLRNGSLTPKSKILGCVLNISSFARLFHTSRVVYFSNLGLTGSLPSNSLSVKITPELSPWDKIIRIKTSG